MKCSKCGHTKAWHISSSECIYPSPKCDCSGFGSVVGFDVMSLLFFTGIGMLMISSGLIALVGLYLSGTADAGPVFMGTLSVVLGLFFGVYMNYRTQKAARLKVLDSKF